MSVSAAVKKPNSQTIHVEELQRDIKHCEYLKTISKITMAATTAGMFYCYWDPTAGNPYSWLSAGIVSVGSIAFLDRVQAIDKIVLNELSKRGSV